MTQVHNRIKTALEDAAESTYRTFMEGLFRQLPAAPILGVRAQTLHRLAKDLAADAPARAAFMADLPHASHEENLIHAYLINAGQEAATTLAEVEAFLPEIDNWAVCDALRPPVLARAPEDLEQALGRWLAEGSPYTVRFAVGMMERFLLDENFRQVHLTWVAGQEASHYYVQTMLAWYLATALAKQWETTYPFLAENDQLSREVRRRAIRKARESRRLPQAHKDALAALPLPADRPVAAERDPLAAALPRLLPYAPWQGAMADRPLSIYGLAGQAFMEVRFFEAEAVVVRLSFGKAGAWAEQAARRDDAVGYVANQDLNRLELLYRPDGSFSCERLLPGDLPRPADGPDRACLCAVLESVADLFAAGQLTNGPLVLNKAHRFQMTGDGLKPLTAPPEDPGPAPLLPAFTLARLAHLPADQAPREVFFFYLFNPVQGSRQPRAVYLVNLDSGAVEWTDVFIERDQGQGKPWQQKLLSRLSQAWINGNSRPAEIFTAQGSLYDQVRADFAAAGISFQFNEDSYVGDDLLAFLRRGPLR